MNTAFRMTALCLALSSCGYQLYTPQPTQDAGSSPTCADLTTRPDLCGACPSGTTGQQTVACTGTTASCTTVCTSPATPGICAPNTQLSDPMQLALFCGDFTCPSSMEATLRYALCNQQGNGVTCHLTCGIPVTTQDAGADTMVDASQDAGPMVCTPFSTYNCQADGCTSEYSGTKLCDRTGTSFSVCTRDARYACDTPLADAATDGSFDPFPQAHLLTDPASGRSIDVSDGRALDVSGMTRLPNGWTRMAVCLQAPRTPRNRNVDTLATGARLHLPASRVEAVLPFAPLIPEFPQNACWIFTVEVGDRRIAAEYLYEGSPATSPLVFMNMFGSAYVQGMFYAADVDETGRQANVTSLYHPFGSSSCSNNVPGFLRRDGESCFGLCTTEGFGPFACH